MSAEPPRPGAIPGWGQQPAEPAEPPAPTEPLPAEPPAAGWGAPAAAAEPPAAPQPPAAANPAAAEPPAAGWGAPATPPPAGPGPQPAPASGWSGGPPPPVKSGSSGCLKGCLIVLVLLVVGGTLAFLMLGSLLTGFLGQFGGDLDDPDAPCAFVADDDVRAVLGSEGRAYAMNALTRATLGLVLDSRVLPAAPDCWLAGDETTPVGRVALHRGGDAAAVFAAEVERAMEVRQDQGGGVTLTQEGYNAGPVPGLFDEAFCTGISPAIQAGVVARRGDRVAYVSLSGPADGSILDMQTTDEGVIWSPSLCRQAAELVRRILD